MPFYFYCINKAANSGHQIWLYYWKGFGVTGTICVNFPYLSLLFKEYELWGQWYLPSILQSKRAALPSTTSTSWMTKVKVGAAGGWFSSSAHSKNGAGGSPECTHTNRHIFMHTIRNRPVCTTLGTEITSTELTPGLTWLITFCWGAFLWSHSCQHSHRAESGNGSHSVPCFLYSKDAHA